MSAETERFAKIAEEIAERYKKTVSESTVFSSPEPNEGLIELLDTVKGNPNKFAVISALALVRGHLWSRCLINDE